MASHEELIKAGSFDEKFKNTLRDYYTYGFMSYALLQTENEKGKLSPSISTISADWNRLNNILSDYFEWSQDTSKVLFMSADSQSMTANPFHRVYRFCRYNQNDPLAYFAFLFALSETHSLTDLSSSSNVQTLLSIDIEEEIKKRSRYQIITFIANNPRATLQEEPTPKSKLYLCSDEANLGERKKLAVSKKDGVFAEKLLNYLRFCRTHANCKMEFTNDLSSGENNPKRGKLKHDDIICHLQGVKNGQLDRIELPHKDYYMVRLILQDKGKLDSYLRSYVKETRYFLLTEMNELKQALLEKESLSSSQLQCFYPGDIILYTGDNNAINSKLEELSNLGILLRKNKNTKAERIPEHQWSLSDKTLTTLFNRGKEINFNFQQRFLCAIDFFSRYALLGEVGSILMSRCDFLEESAFRFKHEYYMQSLNDYNIIDLIYALENNIWCEIEYRNSMTGKHSKILCKPIEIRVSSVNGREYLSYYEPLSRSYSNLRIEFIDSIAYVDDNEILRSNGERITLSSDQVKQDLDNAKVALSYSWGASTTLEYSGNAISKPKLNTVRLRIAFNPKTEAFIQNRLYREQRIGEITVNKAAGYIDFTVKVTDIRELRPWIRSFYSRLIDYSGIEMPGFTIKEDLTELKYLLEKDAIPAKKPNTKRSGYVRFLPKDVIYKASPCDTHKLLFNECFSIYYAVIGDVLTSIHANHTKKYYVEEELENLVDDIFQHHARSLGKNTKELLRLEVMDLLAGGTFLTLGYVKRKKRTREVCTETLSEKRPHCAPDEEVVVAYSRKYDSTVNSFRESILPLTVLECRWLLFIVENAKMNLFLSDDEIRVIREYLSAGSIKKLPIAEHVYYTDRYLQDGLTQNIESQHMQLILDAIRNHSNVYVEYVTAKGESVSGVFSPVIIEYSKRDNLFRGYFYASKSDSVRTMNLARIHAIRIVNKQFDWEYVHNKYSQYRSRNMRKIKVEFYNIKNLADRILNEFAPWKKSCSYDPKTGIYQLTIYYQKQDSFELVVRLLGYGSAIKIMDRDNRVFEQYAMRIEKQIAIERERSTETAKEHSRNDDTSRL